MSLMWHPDRLRYGIATPERDKAVALHHDLGGWILKGNLAIPGQWGVEKFVATGFIDEMGPTRLMLVTDDPRGTDHTRYAVPYFDGSEDVGDVSRVFGVSQQGVVAFDTDKGWNLVDLQTIEGIRRNVREASQGPSANISAGNAALLLLRVYDYFGETPGY